MNQAGDEASPDVPAGHPPVPRGAPLCKYAKRDPSKGNGSLEDWEDARDQAMHDRRPDEVDLGFSVAWLIAAWVTMCLYTWGPDLGVRAFIVDRLDFYLWREHRSADSS